jgi:hypothetical protein
MAVKRPSAHPAASDVRPQRHVIDDTLATTAVFDMAPEAIRPDATDPEGVGIGEAAAAQILARLGPDGRARRPRRRTVPPAAL